MENDDSPIIGIHEIAALLNTSYGYVMQLRNRAKKYRERALAGGAEAPDGIMPEEDFTVSRNPVWLRETIVEWAEKAGRM